MAVWGTPTATEDDAERAVRAALDLVAAVTALGDEVGVPELRARAGVLTGEAAVTLGAEGEGMVAGDLVNTASRIQSLAEPGTVLVGEATRRATEQTVAYEDAGSHELKGKVGLTPLWRALRVVSGARGSLKSAGPRGAVRRPRPRAAPDQGALPRLRGRGQGAPRLDHRHRRDRQVAAGLGVLQVLRRDRPDRRTGTAGAASPTARASPTGRSRTWCGCARGSPRTRSRARRWPSSPRSSRSTSPTRRSAASSSRGSRTCSASRRAAATSGRISSPRGGSSSSGWPPSTRW